jgi:hypothetical protein
MPDAIAITIEERNARVTIDFPNSKSRILSKHLLESLRIMRRVAS